MFVIVFMGLFPFIVLAFLTPHSEESFLAIHRCTVPNSIRGYAESLGAGCSGPAVQTGSGLTAQGLAEVASCRSATRPASRFQKTPFSFSSAHASAQLQQDQTHRKLVYRPLQFPKRSQLFIGAHDKTLSVAMRVNNPDRSPFGFMADTRTKLWPGSMIPATLFKMTPDVYGIFRAKVCIGLRS